MNPLVPAESRNGTPMTRLSAGTFAQPAPSPNSAIEIAAKKGDLEITVIEGGSLEAQEKVEVKSEVEGQTKILSIVDEGYFVTADDVEAMRAEAAILCQRRPDLPCADDHDGPPRLEPEDVSQGGDEVVDHGESLRYLQAQPLEVLGRRDLATTGRRLGVHTVGAFAAWPRARVMERFHRQAVVLHALANGEITEGPGQRDATLPTQLERERHGVGADEQLGFFGGRGAPEIRAREAARRVSRRLGPEAVTVAVLEPGRFTEERGTLVPFGAPVAATSATAPWPGRGGAPAPVTTIRQPAPVAVLDNQGREVIVGTRGHLSAPVERIGFASGVSASVIWSAGPWLSVEHWWVAPRRRAHLQLVTDDGRALLVMSETRRWWLVGVYD